MSTATVDDVTRLPRDIEAERAVLAAILKSPNILGDITPIVKQEDFFEPRHETVYAALLRLNDEGEPLEATHVATYLRRTGELARIGGHAFLHDLTQTALVPESGPKYAETVREEAVKRRIAQFHQRGLQELLGGSGITANEALAAAQSDLNAVAEQNETSDTVPLGEEVEPTLNAVEARKDQEGGVTGVPTGFTDLDERTSGLHPGQLILIAARPAIGKSTLGLDIARSCAVNNRLPCLFFSLEMSREELTTRLISSHARVPLQNLRSGKMTEQDWDRVAAKQGDLFDAPLFMDDTANITLSQIRTKARRIKQRHGLKLVVVDYLQLMTGDRRAESRQQEVSEFSRGLKLLAKELEVPVIAMSQLNRGSEQRADKKPQMSDMRESGSLEQDADVVMLLHREDASDPESPRVGEADIILAKQRNGPTGTITIASQLHLSRFVDMARDGF